MIISKQDRKALPCCSESTLRRIHEFPHLNIYWKFVGQTRDGEDLQTPRHGTLTEGKASVRLTSSLR
jgi:hypothetical protein